MKIFSYDGPFSRIMGRVFDLVLLHILWLVSSLPIVTIGASTTALFTVTMRMVKNEESYILKGYMKAFKENFKKATVLWGIAAAAVLWMLFLMRICMKGSGLMLDMLGIANAALLIVVLLAVLYVFPIQAVFENTVGNILKNALICSMRFLPYSAAMAAVIIVPVLITGFVQSLFPVMIAFWLTAGSSVLALCQSYLLKQVFEKVS